MYKYKHKCIQNFCFKFLRTVTPTFFPFTTKSFANRNHIKRRMATEIKNVLLEDIQYLSNIPL